MATLAELKDLQLANHEKQLQIIAVADQEKRDLSKEEQDELDALQTEYEERKHQIEIREKADSISEELSAPKTPAIKGIVTNAEAAGEKIEPLARSPRSAVPEYARPIDRGRRGFNSMGEFALAVANYSRPGGEHDLRLRQMLAPTTYGSEGVGADGGFAVPPDFQAEINDRIAGEDTLLGMTDQLVTSSNSITIPVDESTAWQNAGGIQAVWMGEGAQGTQSKPVLQQRNIQVHKVMILVPVTDELISDAPAMDRYLRRKAPEKINFEITRTIVKGTGAGQPLGILNSPALVSVSRATSGQINLADIENAYSRMFAQYRGQPGTVWLMNQDVEPQILALNSGTNNNVFFGAPNFGVQPTPGTFLLGHRIIYTQACETLGSKGDVYFAALGQYLTVMKGGGIRADVSTHIFFDYDQVAFRFIFRIAGMPWLSAPISPLNGSTTYSSAVTVAA